MVTVGRSPEELAIHERRYNLIDIVGRIWQKCVFSGDEIAIENDQLWAFVVEDGVDYNLGLSILRWSPGGGLRQNLVSGAVVLKPKD